VQRLDRAVLAAGGVYGDDIELGSRLDDDKPLEEVTVALGQLEAGPTANIAKTVAGPGGPR
jgi:hypothetical protein